MGRIANSEHTERPWRIHQLAPDFALEDVWALPTPGGPNDFPKLLGMFAGGDTATNPSALARFLFRLRWKLGEWFGWDSPTTRGSLRERLPADLAAGPRGPESKKLPFSSVYLTDSEWAAELVNKTVHAIMHLSWVRDSDGAYRGQMAVLVKPNGLFGKLYMAAIDPFRLLIVYPPMMRGFAKRWREISSE